MRLELVLLLLLLVLLLLLLVVVVLGRGGRWYEAGLAAGAHVGLLRRHLHPDAQAGDGAGLSQASEVAWRNLMPLVLLLLVMKVACNNWSLY